MSFMSYIIDPVGDSVRVGAVDVPPAAAADSSTPPDAQPVPDTSLVLFHTAPVEKFGVATFDNSAILWVVSDRSMASWLASRKSIQFVTNRPETVTVIFLPRLNQDGE